jgi:hypothetical protein
MGGWELTAFVGVFDARYGVAEGLAGRLAGFAGCGALTSWYDNVVLECPGRGVVCEATHIRPGGSTGLSSLVEVKSLIAATEFIGVSCTRHVASGVSIFRGATAVAKCIVAD